MFKAHLIITLLCSAVCAILQAEYVPLKGANGRTIEFAIGSVEAEGIRAQPKGSHKEVLIEWEKLDLKWLAENQKDLWEQKQDIEAMLQAAYEGYAFGQSRKQVILKIQAHDGLRLPNELLDETDPNALWITFKPETLRQFLRFLFDAQGQLIEVQVHHNFPADISIDKELQAEWERLIQMVEPYRCPLMEEEPFPSPATWRRLKKKAKPGQEIYQRTHHWADAQREIELAVVSKEVALGVEKHTANKITFFGTDMNITSTAKSNTNWLVYTARSN